MLYRNTKTGAIVDVKSGIAGCWEPVLTGFKDRPGQAEPADQPEEDKAKTAEPEVKKPKASGKKRK